MAEPFDVVARDAASLAKLFRYFGEVETPRLDARVYTDYCLGIAEDPFLLDVAAETMPSQPPPNVLFAAVQDLLLEDPEASDEARALARYYPSIGGGAIPETNAFPALHAFCRAEEAAIRERVRSGRTQTCVVHRSAVMLPAIGSLPRIAAAKGRVGLLEVGPSVGLNLRMDHYRYVYEGEAGRAEWGAAEATPCLASEVRGQQVPPLPDRLDVVARRGLELAPIDVNDPLAVRWLRALVWPEHVERARLMDEALAVAARVPAEIEAGDATVDIEAAIGRLPGDAPRVVFATHAVYQIPAAGLAAMFEGVARASIDQPVDLLIMESNGQGESRIDWLPFEKGRRGDDVVLAHSDSHGRWIDWGRTE